jgi:hypothetical protein
MTIIRQAVAVGRREADASDDYTFLFAFGHVEKMQG